MLSAACLLGALVSVPTSWAAAPTGAVGIYIPPENSSGSVITVTSTIQAAIDAAEAGDVVAVPAGTYVENLVIPSSPTISLIGAGPELSIIRGVNGAGNPVVKFSGGSSTMDGFTITDGNTTGEWEGAGVDIRGGSPTLTNLMIRENHGTNAGGGIYVQSGTPKLSNLTIVNNTATYRGGGIYVNSSSATLVASNLTIVGNLGGEAGVGINNRYGEVRLRNSIFWNNRRSGNNALDELYFFNANYTSETHYFKVSNSILSTGIPTSTGFVNEGNNLSSDPLFEDVAALDFSLGSGSPALDAGSAADTADFDAITEYAGAAPDMGRIVLPKEVQQGAVLTAVNTLADADGIGTITYQWKRGGSAINGATGSTYTLVLADVGAAITVTANYVDDLGNAESVTSAATAAVTALPNAAPVFGGGAVASANAQENNASASYNFSATDGDGQTLVYSIGGDDASSFVINAVTGELTLAQAFDFDNPADTGQDNVYSVTVSVTDGVETVTQAFALTVTNVDEAPVFTSGDGATAVYLVDENATAITSLTAYDDDNDTLVFTISSGDDESKFSLNVLSGALSFVSGQSSDNPTDADNNSTYEVNVSVTANGISASQAITVVVAEPIRLLTAAEYFVDVDPGQGQGTALLAADGAFDSEVESVTPADLNVTGLSEGAHLIGVRYKDDNGTWGDVLYQTIHIYDATPSGGGEANATVFTTIAAAEYFVDTDPGEGAATAFQPQDGAFDSEVESILPADFNSTGLSEGAHLVGVRYKDDNGTWGDVLYLTIHIYDANPSGGEANATAFTTIAAAEYFVDTDPGEGAATAFQPQDGAFDSEVESILPADFNSTGLSEGAHLVGVRYKDDNGTWGDVLLQTIHIYDANPEGGGDGNSTGFAIIVAAEWFVGTDPGEGNGTAFQPADGGFDSEVETVLPTALSTEGFAVGAYLVGVRYKDNEGAWGDVLFATIEVSADTDGDGLLDAEEVALDTNATNPDSDGDGV